MRGKLSIALVLAFGANLAWTGAVLADPDKDESGKGRKRGERAHKVEFWDGGCKVERAFGRDGYEEKRTCRKEERRARRERKRDRERDWARARERDEARQAAREPELAPRVRERVEEDDLPWLGQRRAEALPVPVPRPVEPPTSAGSPQRDTASVPSAPPPPSSSEPQVWEDPP